MILILSIRVAIAAVLSVDIPQDISLAYFIISHTDSRVICTQKMYSSERYPICLILES